jgi:CheY-like chemotaxis protein
MDIMMPEMDGQTAVQEIRALEGAAGFFSTSGARIIMVTALDDVKNVVKSFRALCDAYVFKTGRRDTSYAVEIAELVPKGDGRLTLSCGRTVISIRPAAF